MADLEAVAAGPERFAVLAAETTARMLSRAVSQRGRASVGFSGGSTVGPVFDALVALATQPPTADLYVDWERVSAAQEHEREAAPAHPDRNAAVLLTRLVDALPVRPASVALLPVEDVEVTDAVGGGRWRDEARRRLVQLAGAETRFDVLQLGLGPDGHTASLVPGDPVLDVVDRPVALTGPYQGHRRLTLTYPVLNAARARVWWVVSGQDHTKARALHSLVTGDVSVPAGRVERASTVIVTDGDPPGGSDRT